MKRRIHYAILAASLLAGWGVAEVINTNHAAPASVLPAVAESPRPDYQEDDPEFECRLDGNRICGANPLERVEAWGKFNTSEVPTAILDAGFRVAYLGTAMPGLDFPPSEYVTIPSSITENTVHVFYIEPGVTK